MYFRVLGPLEVSRGQEQVSLGGPKQRTTLAVLLAHAGTVVSTDRLIDEVWGDGAPASARRTLQSFVSNLRRSVNADRNRLRSRDSGYVLSLGNDELDALAFENLVNEGLSALDAGSDVAAAKFRRALEMWLGTPFAGLSDLAPSLTQEVVRLEEIRMAAVEGLGEARLRLGEHRGLVPELQDIVRAHPLRERLWGQLMLALHRSGRSGEALRVYQEARTFFGEELGTEPGQPLQDLEYAILTQDARLDIAASIETPKIPYYVTSLIGRREEMGRLSTLAGRRRLITLVGPPGVGKTRLAVETVSEHSDDARVFWVELGGVDRAGDVIGAVVRCMALRETIGVTPQRLIVARLLEHPSIVVFDNCEHLGDQVAELSKLVLSSVDHVKIIATSREPLALDGEYVFPVPPLDLPDVSTSGPSSVGETDSVSLLVTRAEEATGRPIQLGDTAGIAAEIVRRLDGLPLAIELAAARLRSVSLGELNDLLEDGFRFLVDRDPTVPPRHQSLQAAFETSYLSLSDEERDVLLCLAVLPTYFDADIASAVASSVGLDRTEAIATVTRLVDRSLVVAATGVKTRYRLLESIRSFALERADSAQISAALRSLSEHLLVRAQQVGAAMLGPDIGAWLTRTRVDHDSYLAAIRWSMAEGSSDTALGISASLGAFWYRISYLSFGRALLDEALEHADPTSPWKIRATNARAWLAYAAGAPDAVELAREATDLAEAEGDVGDVVASRQVLAGALIVSGEAQAGLEIAKSALSLASTFGEVEAISVGEQMMGLAHAGVGDLSTAIEFLTRARDRMRAYREDVDAGWILVQLGESQLAAGDVRSAAENADAAVRDFANRRDPKGIAAACMLQGLTLLNSDRHQAREALEKAASVSERWGDDAAAQRAREVLANLTD